MKYYYTWLIYIHVYLYFWQFGYKVCCPLIIREDVPSKLLSLEKDLTEAFFVEINLRNKKKWLISCSYNPKRASITNHLSTLSKCTDIYTSKYDNLIFLGDFNAGVED